MQNRGAMASFGWGFFGGLYNRTTSRALDFNVMRDSIFSANSSPLWGVLTLAAFVSAYKGTDAIKWFIAGAVLGMISAEVLCNMVNPGYEVPSASARPRQSMP